MGAPESVRAVFRPNEGKYGFWFDQDRVGAIFHGPGGFVHSWANRRFSVNREIQRALVAEFERCGGPQVFGAEAVGRVMAKVLTLARQLTGWEG